MLYEAGLIVIFDKQGVWAESMTFTVPQPVPQPPTASPPAPAPAAPKAPTAPKPGSTSPGGPRP